MILKIFEYDQQVFSLFQDPSYCLAVKARKIKSLPLDLSSQKSSAPRYFNSFSLTIPKPGYDLLPIFKTMVLPLSNVAKYFDKLQKCFFHSELEIHRYGSNLTPSSDLVPTHNRHFFQLLRTSSWKLMKPVPGIT